jgi:hypothetical protein
LAQRLSCLEELLLELGDPLGELLLGGGLRVGHRLSERLAEPAFERGDVLLALVQPPLEEHVLGLHRSHRERGPAPQAGFELDGRAVTQSGDLGFQSWRAVNEPGVDLRGAGELLPGEVLAAIDPRARDGQDPFALVLAVSPPAARRSGRARVADHADTRPAGCG